MDLRALPITAMPAPQRLTQTLVLQPAPSLEQLSPPDAQPKIAAAQAWDTMRKDGVEIPTTAGTVQILLGDLYAQFPATIQNYAWPPSSTHPDTNAQPDYVHTLVWAIYGHHQPGVASGGPSVQPRPTAAVVGTVPNTQALPVCLFESTVVFVNADTGQSLLAMNF